MTTAFEEILSRRITPDTQVPQHDFLFRWGNQPCFARGELVALTGKAKSGKTYVCSMLMALAVRPQLLGISRLHDEPLRVVWIDTEQSEDSTQEILCHRIGALIHQPIPEEQFYVYNLRRDNWQDRLGWVELCIAQAKPDLVIFDGIRDVVGDINNYTEAQTVLGKLLSLASWSGACIVCVLHQNKALEDKTLRGALGTELQNKSYETYECQKDPDTRLFTLRQTATRKYDITHQLTFSVNPDGLPECCSSVVQGGSAVVQNGYPALNREYMNEAGEWNLVKLFRSAIASGEVIRAKELETRVMQLTNMVSFKRYNSLREDAVQKGIILRQSLQNGCEYCYATDIQNPQLQLTEIENSDGVESVF